MPKVLGRHPPTGSITSAAPDEDAPGSQEGVTKEAAPGSEGVTQQAQPGLAFEPRLRAGTFPPRDPPGTGG